MRCTWNDTRRRGTALTAVILSLVLVSAALLALGLLFATEAKRTRSALVGAQLRQLLLAAPSTAVDELRRNGGTAREVAVPTPLPNTTLTLHIQSAVDGQAEVRVIAKTPTALAAQTLTYTHTGNEWKLRSAVLGAQP